jgi:hypothetical protein
MAEPGAAGSDLDAATGLDATTEEDRLGHDTAAVVDERKAKIRAAFEIFDPDRTQAIPEEWVMQPWLLLALVSFRFAGRFQR